MRSRIIGTGGYVPQKIIANDEFLPLLGVSSEWITERTGIVQRRAAAPGETTADMATEAARRALQNAGVGPQEVDLIVLGTITGDAATPSTAAIVQGRLGAKNAFAFDLSAASAGALFALSVGDQYIRSGVAKRVLVIGADLLTRHLDWTDRGTCILFGDAAGALLLAPSADDHRGLLASHLYTDGTKADILRLNSLGAQDKLQMNGREVYREAVRVLVAAAGEAMRVGEVRAEQIAHVMGHQANIRIIEAVMSRLHLPMDRFWLTLDRLGNTSAAAIPMCFDEANRAGRLQKDDLILVLAAGAGFTWGSALVRW